MLKSTWIMESMFVLRIERKARENGRGERTEEKKERKKKKLSKETYPCADKWEHKSFIQSKCFSLFHFDSFLVQTFHGIPFLTEKGEMQVSSWQGWEN